MSSNYSSSENEVHRLDPKGGSCTQQTSYYILPHLLWLLQDQKQIQPLTSDKKNMEV